MPHARAAGPLSDVRVLDLTRVRAGPTCCRVLADFGADVIKIEAPPSIDPAEVANAPRHGYDMQNLHRNKRSVTLNLKSEKGRAILRQLVETSDVVVENFRPHVKARLGMAYDDLRAINPRIILASISGFGESGPYSKRGAYDQIIQGMSGLMSVTGQPGLGPTRAGIAVADSASGLYAAIGILLALHERHRSGLGQWVRTSLLQALIALMDFQAARYLIDGVVPEQAGNDHPYSTPMGVFATSDGHINIGVRGHEQWKHLCHALARPDLTDDPAYASQEQRFRNRASLKQELDASFRTRTSRAWLEALELADVPCGPIYRMDEVFADPQVKHVGMTVATCHRARGEMRLVAQPVALCGAPAGAATAAPDPGEHTAAILGELGYGARQIECLRAEKVV